MQQAFVRCVSLFRRRGYAGSIAISGTFGIYTESVQVYIYLNEATDPAEVMKTNPELAAEETLFLEQSDHGIAQLIRTLVKRMESRALKWASVQGAVDPILNCAGTLGITLPVINIGWSATVTLGVYQSTLIRWMEHSKTQTPMQAPVSSRALPAPPPPGNKKMEADDNPFRSASAELSAPEAPPPATRQQDGEQQRRQAAFESLTDDLQALVRENCVSLEEALQLNSNINSAAGPPQGSQGTPIGSGSTSAANPFATTGASAGTTAGAGAAADERTTTTSGQATGSSFPTTVDL